MTRRLKHLLVVAVLLVFAPLFANYANAHGVTLKVQHFLPADSPFHTQFLLPWLAKLESESHGLLRFQTFPTMQMGGTPEQLYDQVKERTADIIWTKAALHAQRFPAFGVFNLPLAMNSSEGSSRALWEYVQAQDLARSEFSGVRLLAVHVVTIDTFILAMNSASYKSLSDELKKVIIANSGAATSAWLGKIADTQTGKRTVDTATELAQKTIEDKIKQLDALGLNGKELVDSARALIVEYDPPK